MEKVVVILSGGMDSTTLLYDVVNQRYNVKALSFNYGQKHKRELEMAKLTTKKLSLEHKVVDLSILNDYIYDTLNIPLIDSKNYNKIFNSILDEMNLKLENNNNLSDFNEDKILFQAINDLSNLLNRIITKYNNVNEHTHIFIIYNEIEENVKQLTIKRNEL